MESKFCLGCGQPFKPYSRVPQQKFCSAQDCQAERKRQWKRNKLKTDPDYKANQAQAQKAWIQRNPEYYRQYRKSHLDYVDQNRILQRKRNAKAKSKIDSIAKMDTSIPVNPLPSGIYQLSLITDGKIAKSDVLIVEITVHNCECDPTV